MKKSLFLVLTQKRPQSLLRLLTSLEKSQYSWEGSPEFIVKLDIPINVAILNCRTSLMVLFHIEVISNMLC